MNNNIYFPEGLIPLKYNGYVYDPRFGDVCSFKSGVIKPLKKKPCSWFKLQKLRESKHCWVLHDKGQKVYVFSNQLEKVLLDKKELEYL